jgi:hypothetical protein
MMPLKIYCDNAAMMLEKKVRFSYFEENGKFFMKNRENGKLDIF